MKNRALAIALSAGLVTGGVAGLAFGIPAISSAQGNTSTTTQGPGNGSGQAKADHDKWMQDALQPLVDNGTINQDQENAVIGALDAARPAHGRGPGGMGRRGPALDTIAGAIGISADDLRTALESGSTIAQVAKDHGVEPQAVIDAMVTELKTHLDEQVSAGHLTQDKADSMLSEATQHITAMVNGEKPAGRPHGGRHHGGPDKDDDAGSGTTTTTTG